MICTLILMRHSHAVGEHTCRDFDRQLTDDGIQLANATGSLLNELRIVPDLILTSAASRTVQTGECVAAQFESSIPLSSRRELYQAGPSAYLPTIQSAAAPDLRTILCVGHNPGIASMISSLAGQQLPVSPATTAVYSVAAGNWLTLPSLNNRVAELTHLIVDAKLTGDH